MHFLVGTSKNLAFKNAGSGSSIRNTTKTTNKTGVFTMKVEDSKPTLYGADENHKRFETNDVSLIYVATPFTGY